MKQIILVISFFSVLFSQIEYSIDQNRSSITYYGKHIAHNWSASSNKLEGNIYFNPDNLESFETSINVPLLSFDSNNSNRDSNMLDVVEDYLFPYVSFDSKSIEIRDSKYFVKGIIFFHGISQEKEVEAEIKLIDHRIIIDVNFSIQLSDFKIKRPSLLTIKIDNKIDLFLHIEAIKK